MGKDDETSVCTVAPLIYLSENCQMGRSTKYPFVIMSIWENKAIKSLHGKSSAFFVFLTPTDFFIMSDDQISKRSKWLMEQWNIECRFPLMLDLTSFNLI